MSDKHIKGGYKHTVLKQKVVCTKLIAYILSRLWSKSQNLLQSDSKDKHLCVSNPYVKSQILKKQNTFFNQENSSTQSLKLVQLPLHECNPVCAAGLSYGSHTVGFTPPATLSRAAISHYNTPALHVHGSSSHAVAVSITPLPPLPPETDIASAANVF